MSIPGDYDGREQSYLKHRVLGEYLEKWAFKLGSFAKQGRIKIWYVDAFAGPWGSHNDAHEDTSVAIGISALEQAKIIWSKKQYPIDVGAVFVEKDPDTFAQLDALVKRRAAALTAIRSTALSASVCHRSKPSSGEILLSCLWTQKAGPAPS